jgi:hypothetical protein
VASPGSINVPTGTVTLEDASNGNAVVGTGTLSNGSYTFTVAAGTLSVGTHSLFTVYSGDTYHQTTTSNSVSQVINPAGISTTTTLVDNGLSAATAGGSIEAGYSPGFTVTVTPASGAPATGTVQLVDAANGNALVGSAQTLVNGTVTFAIPATAANDLGAGTHELVAVYAPTGNFLTSSSGQVGQVIDSVFKVQTIGTSTTPNITQTATGFQTTFNALVNPADENIDTYGKVSYSLGAGATAITSATQSGTTVTIALASGPTFASLSNVVVGGVGVAGYNGLWNVTSVNTTNHTFTYTTTAGLASSSGGEAGAAVAGSVVYDNIAAPTQAIFVQTGTFNTTDSGSPAYPVSTIPSAGILTPGLGYIATVSGNGTTGLFDSQGHILNTAATSNGSDTLSTFNSSNSATADVVNVPDFARAATQPVNIPPETVSKITSLTESGTTATAVLSSTTGFAVGQAVTIANVNPQGYDSTFTIASVTGSSIAFATPTNLGNGTVVGNSTAEVASGTGMPISITVPAGGTALTSASFNIFYNAADLTVTGYTLPSGYTATVNLTTPGEVIVSNLTPSSPLAAGTTTDVISLVASVPSNAPYGNKEVIDVRNIVINGSSGGIDGSAVHIAAYAGDAFGSGSYSSQDAFLINSVGSGSSLGFTSSGTTHFPLLDPKVLADLELANSVNGQDAFVAQQVNLGNARQEVATTPSTTVPPPAGPDPRLFFVGTGSEAGTAPSGGAGSTVTVAIDMSVTEAAGLTYNSDDLDFFFNPNLFQISNVRSGTMAGYFGSNGADVSTGANIDNVGGSVRIGQYWQISNPPLLPNGTVGDLVLFDVTILSNATPSISDFDLAFNVSSSHTDVNGGSAVLSPAPTNGVPVGISTLSEAGSTVTVTTSAADGFTNGQTVAITGSTSGSGSLAGYAGTYAITVVNSTTFTYTDSTTGLASATGGTATNFDAGVDGLFSVVGPSAELYFTPTTNVTGGSTFTVQVNLLVGPGGLTYNSDDLAVYFDPSVLQVTNVTSGAYNTTNPFGSNVSTGYNPDNVGGTIRIGQYWQVSNPPVLSPGENGDVADITFTVNPNATGSTQLILGANVSSTHTDINGTTTDLSPLPTNSFSAAIDGVVNVVLQPNQPPQESLPKTAIGPVLFNPAAVPGLQTVAPNAVAFSNSNLITVSDADGPTSGTTSFETTTVSLVGSGPGAGGGNPVGKVTATATGSSAAVSTNATGPVAIAGASWNAGVATITLGSPSGFLVGQSVTISGMTPAGYNGTVNVTGVSGNTFSYALATNPGTATAFGTETSGLAISGNLTDLNATLATLVYTPGAGFYGTANVTVSTDDNGNTGFGGPQVTSKTVGIPVVGLFENMIDLNAPAGNVSDAASGKWANTSGGTATLTGTFSPAPAIGQEITVTGFTGASANLNGTFTVATASGTTITYKETASSSTSSQSGGHVAFAATDTTQFLDVYSTLPSYKIPSTVYVVGIDGQQNTLSSTAGGSLAAVGSVQDIVALGGLTTGSNGYLTLFEQGNQILASGGLNQQGASGQNTAGAGFGNGSATSAFFGVAGVHSGLGGTGSLSDLQGGSVSYLLIQTPTVPALGNNIDGGSTSSATVAGGATYAGWNVLDGVGILRNATGATPDRSYAPITFKGSANTTGTTIQGSNVATTSGYAADFVARIAQNTGETNSDWLASNLTGAASSYSLSANSTQYAGQPIDDISGPNYWTVEETVQVNDGSAQHSQVSQLMVEYNSAVSIADLTSDFQVLDASGNPVPAIVTDSNGLSNLSNDSYAIVGATESGNSVTITLQPGTDTAGQAAPPSDYTVGEKVLLQGIATVAGTPVVGYDGLVTLTSVTSGGYRFTFNAATTGLPTITPTDDGSGTGTDIAVGGTNTFATGPVPDSGVTAVTVTFVNVNKQGVASDAFVYSSGGTDGLGNTVGLSDGNYFLNTKVADITSNGYALDGLHNGTPGSNTNGSEVDEFWRLFGDANGDRKVNSADTAIFRTTYGSTGYGSTQGGTGTYLWYFDYNMDGNVNGTDLSAYSSRLGDTLNP